MGSLVPRLDVDRGVPVVDLRVALGGVFAYGLGVVRLSGLKLWPVSMPVVEVFHRGRWSSVEGGRGGCVESRLLTGVIEPSRPGEDIELPPGPNELEKRDNDLRVWATPSVMEDETDRRVAG